MQKGEDNLVAWIADRFPAADLPIGIGDDMAHLPSGPGGVLLTTDMLMDGVDFDSRSHSPERIGRKALAVSLSDCAAMAVRPGWALVSVALPDAWSMAQAQGLLLGMEPLAREYDVRIVGGDTNSWEKPLVIDVVLVAEPWPGVPPVRRSGARPADFVYVTGRLGGSLVGHHLDFQPRVREARWLAERLGPALHAMMDLSDGLSTDAARLARASGCGIELDEGALSGLGSEAAVRAGSSGGRLLLDRILNDGEDFELFFAAGPEADVPATIRSDSGAAVPCTRVGRVFQGKGLWLVHPDGRRSPIESRGWEHFKGV